MNQEELRALLRSGIEAAQNNNTILARDIFREVLAEDPDNELAWMWLAQSVDGDFQRMQALEQVVRINPGNARAQEALRRLGGGGPAPASRPPNATSVRVGSGSGSPANAKPVFTPKNAPTKYHDNLWKSKNQRTTDPTRLVLMASLALLAIALIGGAIYYLGEELNNGEEPFPTATSIDSAGGGGNGSGNNQVPTRPTRTRIPPPTIDPNFTPATAPAVFTPTDTATDAPPPTDTPVPARPDSELKLIIQRDFQSFNTLNSDGTGANPLTLDIASQGISAVYSGIYSPDGNRIAFIGELGGGVREVFVGDASTGAISNVSNLGASQTWDPAWSPDGRFIAFTSNAGGTLGLYLVNVDGGSPTLIKSDPDDLFIQPEFSPDGNYLVYVAGPSNGLNNEVFMIPVSDPNIVCELTDGDRNSTSPAFSPDGTHIAFISNRNDSEETDLYLMNADGSVEVLLSQGDGSAKEYAPSWSPDGHFIAVISDRATEEDLALPTGEPNAEGTPAEPVVVNRLWIVDVSNINNILWYPIVEVEAIGRTNWQPTGTKPTVAPVGSCAVAIPPTSTPEGGISPVEATAIERAEDNTAVPTLEATTPEATLEGTPAEGITPTAEGTSAG